MQLKTQISHFYLAAKISAKWEKNDLIIIDRYGFISIQSINKP